MGKLEQLIGFYRGKAVATDVKSVAWKLHEGAYKEKGKKFHLFSLLSHPPFDLQEKRVMLKPLLVRAEKVPDELVVRDNNNYESLSRLFSLYTNFNLSPSGYYTITTEQAKQHGCSTNKVPPTGEIDWNGFKLLRGTAKAILGQDKECYAFLMNVLQDLGRIGETRTGTFGIVSETNGGFYFRPAYREGFFENRHYLVGKGVGVPTGTELKGGAPKWWPESGGLTEEEMENELKFGDFVAGRVQADGKNAQIYRYHPTDLRMDMQVALYELHDTDWKNNIKALGEDFLRLVKAGGGTHTFRHDNILVSGHLIDFSPGQKKFEGASAEQIKNLFTLFVKIACFMADRDEYLKAVYQGVENTTEFVKGSEGQISKKYLELCKNFLDGLDKENLKNIFEFLKDLDINSAHDPRLIITLPD